MKNIYWLIVLTVLFSACSRPHRFVIGVSQCSDDEWRGKMNREMLRESSLYDGTVAIEIKTANDDTEQQKRDILYFMEKKVDVLVVAPNEAAPLTSVVEKVFDSGIPVIIVDRKILSDKYSAFIGADNYEIGKTAGEYIVSILKGKGTVLELTGLKSSSPAFERHLGFLEAIGKAPDVQLLASVDAGWRRQDAEYKADSILGCFSHVDVIFSQNDRMAVGARKAAQKIAREGIRFVGIDALPGKDMGIDLVLNGELDATFIYPTGGDKVIQIAMDILRHEPVSRETILNTALVDKTNARLMKMQSEQILLQDEKMEVLSDKIGESLARYANQRIILYGCVSFLCLFAIMAIVLRKSLRLQHRMNETLSKRNEEITLQKEQLEQQRDQLVSLSKKLEEATHAKLMFFTNVSHDFRTPLTLVADPVNQLLQDKDLNREQRDLLQIVKKNVTILLRLVNQILEFRKYENGKQELHLSHCNLKESVEEWTHAFLPTLHRKFIKFEFETENVLDNQWFFVCDKEKIERVYFNLLSNAVKFTPENGKIKVRLSQTEKNGCPFFCIYLSDTGIGISPEHIRNIFDRFYRIDTHFSGSGIGLALVKAFVELHGGEIDVESNEGKGTVFSVMLPSDLKETEYLGKSEIQPEENTYEECIPDNTDELEDDVVFDSAKESVLIIDDNADIRSYIKRSLCSRYTVIEAENGLSGFRMAMKYIPDVIISDIMMPEMDGIECCKRLKKEMQTCHIPVILLTACNQDEQRIDGFLSGADSFMAKPFNLKVLETRIQNLIEGRKRLCLPQNELLAVEPKSVLCDMDKEFIRKFKSLIEENMSDSALNIEDLGKNMGLSRVQLYRKVKTLTNFSPNEYLRMVRLKRASRLLSSSDMSVSEICYEVGFASPSYFAKCYKDQYGESPTKSLKRK